MNEPSIAISRLDYLTRMLAETKKVISYDKGSGQWNWVDADCIDSAVDYHCGFNTWLDAVVSAVEPYINKPMTLDDFCLGEKVDVTRHEGDLFNHDFTGRVKAITDLYVVVEDQDGECWSCEPNQISCYFQTKS